MPVDNEYYILTDYFDSIIWGRLNEGEDLVEPLSYDELPKLSDDVLKDIEIVEDIYNNKYVIEEGWKDLALLRKYNELMLSIGERIKILFEAKKVHVWQESNDNPQYVVI